MPEPQWKLASKYDYRFGALMLQATCNAAHSPIFHVRLSDMLRDVPQHELQAYLEIAERPSLPEPDLEAMRRNLIRNTDFKGKSVLDIGGYDGWAAKLALDCGAKRAICLDNHQYEHYGWKKRKYDGVVYYQGDIFARSAKMQGDTALVATDQEVAMLGGLDVIIFYNVLYHLKNPWAALDTLRELIKPDGEMLLCSLVRYHDGPWMYLYEPRECNDTDDTVYFGPSIEALERLLKLTGWDATQEGLAGDRACYRCKPTPGWQRKHEDS